MERQRQQERARLNKAEEKREAADRKIFSRIFLKIQSLGYRGCLNWQRMIPFTTWTAMHRSEFTRLVWTCVAASAKLFWSMYMAGFPNNPRVCAANMTSCRLWRVRATVAKTCRYPTILVSSRHHCLRCGPTASDRIFPRKANVGILASFPGNLQRRGKSGGNFRRKENRNHRQPGKARGI